MSEMKTNGVEPKTEAINCEKVIEELRQDPKLMMKAAKAVERRNKREAFKQMSIKEKAKVIAKPVIIGSAIVGAVGTAVAVAVSKSRNNEEIIEGEGTVEDLQPWDYGQMEGISSQEEAPTETVDLG